MALRRQRHSAHACAPFLHVVIYVVLPVRVATTNEHSTSAPTHYDYQSHPQDDFDAAASPSYDDVEGSSQHYQH